MKFLCTAVLSLGLASADLFAQADKPTGAATTAGAGTYVPVHKFDPKRDAAADIRAAIAEAQRNGKRIILDVGGDWCTWCHVLDRFFEQHSEIAELRDKNFITVDIYYGHEQKNEKALSRFPKVEGIPHFFVLEKDGSLLSSQAMLKLETGGEPSVLKMRDFLAKWAPGATGTAEKKD